MHNHSVVDVQKAVSAGVSADASAGSDEIGVVDSMAAEAREAAQEMLLSLPGINRQNYREVMKKVENLRQLSRMSEAELSPLIGPGNAKKLVTFFKQSAS